jgi:hypothetical protein
MAPVVLPLLALALRGALSQQPADMPLALGGDAPAAPRHTLLAQPPFGALPPPDRPPLPAGQGLQQLVDPLRRRRRLPLVAHPEVGAHGHAIALLPRFQARQDVGVAAVVGIGHHAAVGHTPGPGLIEPRQGELGLSVRGHLGWDAGFASAFGVFSPRLQQIPLPPTGHVAWGSVSPRVTAS